MRYKKGDIVLIRFPFTTLTDSKKRPVLIIKDENEWGDIICFQVTSKKYQSQILAIEDDDYAEEVLKIDSFVKYDKCFTLNREIVEKRLTTVKPHFLKKVNHLFCAQLE